MVWIACVTNPTSLKMVVMEVEGRFEVEGRW